MLNQKIKYTFCSPAFGKTNARNNGKMQESLFFQLFFQQITHWCTIRYDKLNWQLFRCSLYMAVLAKSSNFHNFPYATLQWRHNDRDGVSNYQCLESLLIRLVRRRSKNISKLCVTGLCGENPPVTGGFPHKGPVTRKLFPFRDVIM